MRAFRAAYPTINLNGAVAEKEMFALTRTKIPAMYATTLWLKTFIDERSLHAVLRVDALEVAALV